MFSAHWCEVTWHKWARQRKERVALRVFSTFLPFSGWWIWKATHSEYIPPQQWKIFSVDLMSERYSKVWFHLRFFVVSARVCLKFSKRMQLKLRGNCNKTPKSCAILKQMPGKCHAVHYWVMDALGRLLSTQEARVTLGYHLGRLLHFLLSKLLRASMTLPFFVKYNLCMPNLSSETNSHTAMKFRLWVSVCLNVSSIYM